MVVSDTCLARLVVEAGAAGATPKPTKSFCADSHSSRLRLISAVNVASGTVDKSMSVICLPTKMFVYQYSESIIHTQFRCGLMRSTKPLHASLEQGVRSTVVASSY